MTLRQRIKSRREKTPQSWKAAFRKAAQQIRITAQLIDAASGAHLWAERFDGSISDIFYLQDQVTASVVGSITPKLEQAEIERAKRKPTESLDAYDHFLRGMACFHQHTKETLEDALRHFNQAVEADRNFAGAHEMAAWCFACRAYETAEGVRLARRAAELARDDAIALYTAGFALAYLGGDLSAGMDLISRALLINPNLALAWGMGGWVNNYLDEPDSAIEHFERAIRLSPLDPLMYTMQAGMAMAHFSASRNEEAAAWAIHLTDMVSRLRCGRDRGQKQTCRGRRHFGAFDPNAAVGRDATAGSDRTQRYFWEGRKIATICKFRVHPGYVD